MKTRVELRAVRVRKLRGEDDLPVARFGATASQNDHAKLVDLDLLEVLNTILSAKVGTDHVVNEAQDEADEGVSAEPKPLRAISVTGVNVDGRSITVNFEWSLNAPSRIYNFNSGETTYRGTDGDAGMTGGTVVIRVPISGSIGYIAVEHRSGLVSVFEPALAKWFREFPPVSDFRLHLSGYIPEDFWRQFLENGTVLELSMERHVIPRDIVEMATGDQDAAKVADAGTTRVKIEVAEGARTPAKKWLKSKWEEITSTTQSAGKGYFVHNGEQYTSLKARMSDKGVERTIVVGPEPNGRLAPAFPIEVSEARPGVADPAQLAAEMISLLDESVGS